MKEIMPIEAYQILQDDEQSLLVDVRSTMEYEYVGHPVGALHVPIKEPPAWETRADFVEVLKQAILEKCAGDVSPEDHPMLMLCRSGKRSELAAQMLLDAGFNKVYNIIEGFEGDKDEQGHRNTVNGWRYHNLPWEQS